MYGDAVQCVASIDDLVTSTDNCSAYRRHPEMKQCRGMESWHCTTEAQSNGDGYHGKLIIAVKESTCDELV